ncbi:MAG: TRAP transporter small permease [Alphaproteobacteria bacterium]|nr:TRAP transporter small permease [Alphaproteobacteria bacterium]
MSYYAVVSPRQRHLKWRSFDALEAVVMVLCGIAIGGFTITVFFDVTTRAIGHPWLYLQEVTSHFFVYGVFLGSAAATRRNDHLYLSAIVETLTGRTRMFFETFTRLVVLAVACCLLFFGFINFLHGFGSKRMPSLTPESTLTAAIPLCGLLVALFTVEQLVNGWRNGFARDEGPAHASETPA